MTKFVNLAAAALFAAAALAGLTGLVAAAEENAATSESCQAQLCFIALF
jgi:hypothetical protein